MDKKNSLLNNRYSNIQFFNLKKTSILRSSSNKKLFNHKKDSNPIKDSLLLNKLIKNTNSFKQTIFRISSNKKLKSFVKTQNKQLGNNKNNYNFIQVLGKGGFGKVYLVEQKADKNKYALKVMSKRIVIQKKSVNSILNEKNILSSIKSEFIINILCSFQDRQNLYLKMNYLGGGDLRFHLYIKKFNEEEVRFIACCIIKGLEDVHRKGFIHRDIKPENLVFEESGYLRITDFGISRKIKQENYNETSGTPCYMCPEVLLRKNHGFDADFYALGIILYEICFNKRPYNGRDRREIRDFILTKQIKIKNSRYSEEFNDFVNGLLLRKRHKRLGYNGASELKSHPWLKDISWKSIKEKSKTPPYKPDLIILNKYLNQLSNNSNCEINNENSPNILPIDSELFKDYNYDVNN